MTPLKFEALSPLFTVANANVQVVEGPTAAFINPNEVCIIAEATPFDITFDWDQSGSLIPIMSGIWECSLFIETWGSSEAPNPFPTSLKASVAFNNTGAASYSASVNIPGNTLPVGVHKLVAVIQLKGAGGVASPIVMMGEIGFIQIY